MEQHNPDFSKSFVVDYTFEQQQPFKFRVFDYDEGSSHDFLGETQINLSQIMGSRG